MTFAQMKGLVHTAMQDWTHGAATRHPISMDHVALWVQHAVYRLDADLQWTQLRETLSITSGTRRYSLSAGSLQVQYMTYDGAELDPLTTIEEIARQEIDDSTGTPAYYAWYGGEIALYPTPDTTDSDIVEAWLIKTPEALTDDDEPTLPPHTHNLIVDYALYAAHRHVGDLERMQAEFNLYQAALQLERTNYVNRRGVMGIRRDSKQV